MQSGGDDDMRASQERPAPARAATALATVTTAVDGTSMHTSLPLPVLPRANQTVGSLSGRVGHPRAPSRPSARHGAQRSRVRGQRGGTPLGASELVIYLVDYAQTVLVPIPCPDASDRHELTLEGTLAGRAFRSSTPLESADVDGHRIWMPVVDGVSRVGVLEVLFRQGPPTDQEREALHRYAGLVGHLVVIKGEYGDVFEFVRRRAPMSVAAELQWSLLPR